MPDLDTAEYRKLALIAAGVPLESIPPIIDTATWRHMLIAALLKNAASQVISGSVDYYSQLPTTLGSPAVGTTYLVRYSSGIYYINYRSAGVYMKVTDTGSASDWVYIPMSAVGTLPDATITNPQIGDALIWNGNRWSNTQTTSVSQFLTAGTFSLQIESRTKSIDVICIGGGGGGGGGLRTGNGPSASYGASGGGGGGMSMYSFRMPSSSNLSCTIVVGSGGGGGIIGSGNATFGGTSSFKASNGVEIFGNGGGPGINGSTAIPTTGGSGGNGMFVGGSGVFYQSNISGSPAGGGGGGSGGGANSANQVLPSFSGTTPICVRGPNSVTENNVYGGAGGNGGAGSVFGNPTSGSSGTLYGAGGGGGGSTMVGGIAGAGGSGSSGAVVVIQHF
jgi:hypothetical protein